MRLWHQDLISKLPRQQLLGQHRECCALRGCGWGRNHSVVNYVFTYTPDPLVAYHFKVMDEMKARGYHPDEIWYNPDYRGSVLGMAEGWTCRPILEQYCKQDKIFIEHNDEYLQECIDNLKGKGIEI